MKKKLLHIFVTIVAFGMIPFPGISAVKYKSQPSIYSGSMMPYDFSRCDSVVAWGDSLKPVYLGYVARHGARFLSSPKKIDEISKALVAAESKAKLTAQGEKFLALLREVSMRTDGRWGLLSEVGIREEQKLGTDMSAMLPYLFSNGKIEAKSTYVPRVIMTMYQFLHSLEIHHPHVEIYTSSGMQNDSLLRCFVTDTAYASYRDNGEWKPVYEDFLKKHVSSAPARRLFVKGYENDRQHLRHLTMSMYGLLQANLASGLPATTTEFMSEQEYKECWIASNVLHYLRNNINPVSGLAGRATAPLLNRIISDADSALGNIRDIKAHGYFGHAETLLPLFSLMRLPGCYVMTDDFESLADTWQVQEITPLAANLAIILLRGDSGEVYASLRLNGRNISPLPDKGCLVKWDELKDFWMSLLD